MIDEGVGVGLGQPAVPDHIRIHDRVRSVEARAQAATWRHLCNSAAREQLSLHRRHQLGASAFSAGRFSAGDRICADEEVTHNAVHFAFVFT
jgi:hypothetical protein